MIGWWLLACASSTAPSAAPLDLPEGSAVAYVLAWDWDEALDWSGSRVFVTDEGYAVGLEAAWLSTLAVELVPCANVATGPLDWLVPSARANHTTGADRSLVEAVLAEDLLAGTTVELGVATTGEASYCEAYALAGVSTESGVASLAEQTIHLRGWYVAPQGEARVPFVAEVGLGAAALPELTGAEDDEALFATDGSPIDARVTILRHPARALDGERLEQLSEAEIAYAFLAGLGRTAEARWTR